MLLAIGLSGIPDTSFSQAPEDNELIPLEVFRKKFKEERQRIVLPLEKLNGLYYQQLSKLRDSVQAEGDLPKVVAINAEIRILGGKAPEEQAPDFEELARIRSIYEKAKIKRSIEVAQQLIPLFQKASEYLEARKIALTKANQIEEATILNDEIESLNLEIQKQKELIEDLELKASGKTRGQLDFPEVLKKDLVVRYDFDTPPEQNLISSKIPEDFPALVESAEWIDSGKHGGAMRFNGVDSQLRLSKTLPDSDELTLSAWVLYEAKIESNGAIFSDFDGRSGNDLMFGLVGGKTVFVRAYKGKGNNLFDSIALEEDVVGQWHHLVWTLDSSRSNIYLNGKRAGSVPKKGSNNGYHDGFIGFGNNGKGWVHFEGVIDELAVWSTDLSASDIERLYQATR